MTHTCSASSTYTLPCITSPSPTVNVNVLGLSTTCPDSKEPLVETLARDWGVGLVETPAPARIVYKKDHVVKFGSQYYAMKPLWGAWPTFNA